jgi:hypothetical protein
MDRGMWAAQLIGHLLGDPVQVNIGAFGVIQDVAPF